MTKSKTNIKVKSKTNKEAKSKTNIVVKNKTKDRQARGAINRVTERKEEEDRQD
jgi:hypothetical protein